MATTSLTRFSRFAFATAVVGAAGSLLGATLLGGSVTSCLTTQSYVYYAQRYDPTGDCLETSRAVEVVNGEGASSACPAMCLTVGADVLVSTVCPPLPAIATELEADAGDCIAALAAAERGGTCDAPPDAGAAEVDADTDAAEEETDAGEDAPTDTDAADAAMPADAAEAG
jgi:hypothetical protein